MQGLKIDVVDFTDNGNVECLMHPEIHVAHPDAREEVSDGCDYKIIDKIKDFDVMFCK